MTTLALLLLAATLSYVFSTLLKVSSIPLLILSGILLKLSGVLVNLDEVHYSLLLGLTFLVFLAGTELNPNRIGRFSVTALKVGLFQFIALAGMSFSVALLFGLNVVPSFYLGLAVAASSTLVVVRILQRNRQFFEPFGRLVLGVLLVQDGITIAFISVLAKGELSVESIMVSIASLALIFATSLLFQKKLAPYLFVNLKLDEETLLLVSLAVLFMFSFLAKVLGLHFIVGAFFGGFALSAFPIHGIVNSQLISLSDFFVAIFFVALGATLVFPQGSLILLSLVLIVLVIVLTPIIVLVVAERARLSTRSALEAGLLLAQTSEFSLIIGLIGFQAGHLDQSLLGLIALITVTTMVLTPLLATDQLTWRLTKLRPSTKNSGNIIIPDNHILVLGCGESMLELLLKYDSKIRARLLVVDYDPGVLSQLRKENILTLRGDAADPRILKACKAMKASLIVSTLTKVEDNILILKQLASRKVLVRVQELNDAEKIEKFGGTPVIASKLSANILMEWIKGLPW